MSIGFIMTRHVNSEQTNCYWQECYDCIRKLYNDNKIIIIDDNSNYQFITKKECYNTEIVQSEYIGRAELLPYYYYSKHKWFDMAIIIHDSIFIYQPINTNIDKYRMLWHFNPNWYTHDREHMLIKSLDNNNNLLEFHNQKHLWNGSFGVMSIITYEYLNFIDTKYNLSNLLDKILSRSDR